MASKVVPTCVAEVSTTGDCPVTVIDSVSDASFMSAFTVAVKPTLIRMPSLRTVPKPASSKTTVYSPGGTAVNRYWPSGSLTAVRAPMRDWLVSVTVTPGITADVPSVIRPLMAPVPEVTA